VEQRRAELKTELQNKGLKLKAQPLPNGGRIHGRSSPALWGAFVLSGDWR
jgi:hypothetical protein